MRGRTLVAGSIDASGASAIALASVRVAVHLNSLGVI